MAMNEVQRKALTERLVNELQKTHEQILKVAEVAQEIGTDSPALAMVIAIALMESQEPLAQIHGMAKSALNMTAEERAAILAEAQAEELPKASQYIN